MSDEILVCDEKRPGIELIEYRGAPGYGEEQFILENSLSNGLRFTVMDKEDAPFWAHFHIHNPETARKIAARLNEFADRIANPPSV